MLLSTDGLTLGTINGLSAKGYKIEMQEGGLFANVSLEAPLRHSVDVPDREGWGSLGEYME